MHPCAAPTAGLVTLHKKLHNPFLAGKLHVAHEPIVNDGLRQLAERLMEGTAFLPPGTEDQLSLPQAMSATVYSTGSAVTSQV